MFNTRRFKAGLVLSALVCLINVPSVVAPTPEGEAGPPFAILVIGTLFGVIGLVATALAWRGNMVALRVTAACLIVTALTSVPALFVDVSAGVKLGTAAVVGVTIVALVLMFGGARQRESVTVAG